jgi:hypothetical protein
MAQIDVKAEGRKMRAKQAQRMRDTAEDQGDVYKYVKKYPRATKQQAAKGEIYDIMTTDPGSKERKTAIRKRMYLENSLRDGSKKRVAGSKKVNRTKQPSGKKTTRKRVAGK